MARALEIKMWFERTTFFDSLFEARLASHWFHRYHFDVKNPKTLIVAQDISLLSLKSVSYVVFHFGEESNHFFLTIQYVYNFRISNQNFRLSILFDNF